MNKDFNSLNLSSECVNAILAQGFSAPTQIQEQAIPLINEGRDLIALSQTGTGKTLAFAAPLIDKINLEAKFGVQVLVLVPTRELAEQVLGEVKKLLKCKPDVKATAIFGGQDIGRQIIALKRGANFVIGTPGRIMDHMGRRTIKLGGIKTVVLDEADEMLNMGFRQDMEKILALTPAERQTLMFSATMNNDIMSIVKNYLKNPVTLKVGETNRTIASIKQAYFMVGKDKKKQALSSLLRDLEAGTTIVFCNTKRMVDTVEGYLKKQGFNATGLHGDMKQNIRRRIMQDFKSKEREILVTTDISARGIDVKDVLHVINFDLPQNLEYYIHRVGRTGRAGKGGNAYTLINTPSQINDLREIERKTQTKISLAQMELSVEPPAVGVYENKKRPQKLNNVKRGVRSANPNKNTHSYDEDRVANPRRKQRKTYNSKVRGEDVKYNAAREAGQKPVRSEEVRHENRVERGSPKAERGRDFTRGNREEGKLSRQNRNTQEHKTTYKRNEHSPRGVQETKNEYSGGQKQANKPNRQDRNFKTGANARGIKSGGNKFGRKGGNKFDQTAESEHRHGELITGKRKN